MTIYATVGCSCSGKTTWSRKISGVMPILSYDACYGHLYGTPKKEGVDKDVKAWRRTAVSHMIGETIMILDRSGNKEIALIGPFSTRWFQKKLIESLCGPLSARHKIIWVNFEETLKTLLERAKSDNRTTHQIEVVEKQFAKVHFPAEGRLPESFLPQ